jgi:hypothetical protein
MKRSGFIKRRTPLKVKGHSDTALVKEEIQAVVRDIVIKRDGGCILSSTGDCNGYRKDGELILQADHLITRANAATYADPRLIVCVCKGHHGWKRWHEREYNALVRSILSADRVKLWDACEKESWKPHRAAAYNWPLTLAAPKQEYAQM